MPLARAEPNPNGFNTNAVLPYNLRLKDFELAMHDVYDFFYDVNSLLLGRNLERLDDTLRPAIMSGLLSDMLTASMAKHSRSLTVNEYFNGHPDLVVKGVYQENKVKAGTAAFAEFRSFRWVPAEAAADSSTCRRLPIIEELGCSI
jgi:hypothetical protein